MDKDVEVNQNQWFEFEDLAEKHKSFSDLVRGAVWKYASDLRVEKDPEKVEDLRKCLKTAVDAYIIANIGRDGREKLQLFPAVSSDATMSRQQANGLMDTIEGELNRIAVSDSPSEKQKMAQFLIQNTDKLGVVSANRVLGNETPEVIRGCSAKLDLGPSR